MATVESVHSNIRTNRSRTVHLGVSVNGRAWHPLCGSGDVGVGTRRRSTYSVTQDAVTCKKCLKRLAEKSVEEDAKTACERERLTGRKIRLSDGAVVTVERHNGYVMSGWDEKRGWWAIDLRIDKATVPIWATE